MTPLDIETRTMFAATVGRVFSTSDAGANVDGIWAELAEGGVLALGIPEWADGVGGGMADLGMVMRSIGAALSPAPYLSTVVISAWLVASLEGRRGKEGLSAFAAGKRRISLAHYEPDAGYSGSASRTAVAERGSGPVLNGRKHFVLDAEHADAFLVTARDAAGLTRVCLVDRHAPGLEVSVEQAVDGTRIGRLTLRGATAKILGDGDAAGRVEEALERANVAVCAEALGAMEEITEKTREYLRTRRAFGRTLSQFQVLQHRFVDMLIALEETRAVVEAAEAACDHKDADRATAVHACKITTGRTSRFVSAQGIQLHGGVGVTDELIISRYYKRLMMLEASFGNSAHHLRVFAGICQQRYGDDATDGSAVRIQRS
ncbi:acyl-CoA dehydrogenase family protein [Mesorhizobium sp. CAU 1741]|uniref:acyl-CoA dehydrogenase family protein n=1 Tax=Mesorhizobium sp. CAU 1741 TaxID=3140366 RepID=UPI00325B0332